MTENNILHNQLGSWLTPDEPQSELVLSSESFISEEKKPFFFSVCLEDSVCSGSVDMNAPDIELLYSMNNYESKFKNIQSISFPKRQKNYFASNKLSKFESPIVGKDSIDTKIRKCNSLQDVYNISELEMTTKSMNGVSCETIHSHSVSSTTKSKDSGIQRSLSCISLTSGKPNFDHVESKVKAYIRNIKETEALRKKNKNIKNLSVTPTKVICDEDIILNKEDLLLKIQELQLELQEKALYIDAQQKNYNSLLLKLAEAKNTIDRLRLQSMSLNYNSLYESEGQLLSHDIESLEFTYFKENTNGSKPLLKAFNDIQDIDGKKEQDFSGLNLSNHSKEIFRPKEHSTPQHSQSSKSLSPINKMCSSSSRIDKHCKPLSNLKKGKKLTSYSLQSVDNINEQLNDQQIENQLIGKTKKGCEKQMHKVFGDNQKLKLSNIDLPNDDPFLKVQKWQASLPSINLLVSYSSSECELTEEDLKNISNFIETKNGIETDQGGEEDKDKNIIQSLTQELVTKCRISEKYKCAIDKSTSQQIDNKIDNLVEEVLPSNTKQKSLIKNMVSMFNNSTLEIPNANVGLPKNPINLTNSNNNNKCKQQASKELFKCLRSNLQSSINTPDSLVSESESCSYFPKSSSMSRTVNNIVKDGFDDNDDSSSISSSVLESMSSFSTVSQNKASKRKNIIDSDEVKKIPKLGNKKPFVLREPKLNVPLSAENSSHTTKSKITPDFPGNDEKWFKYRNSNVNVSRNSYFKTESSEKRAWRARNNANFFVCKDFYFEKSTSLHNCIAIMEGMVQRGSSIIESALDRCY